MLATTGVAHVIPGGAAGGVAVGCQLLASNGVQVQMPASALATGAIGSAIVLNLLLWLSLLISIPLAGLHPVYVAAALLGLSALFGAAALVYTFTRGEERAVRFVRAVGRRVPSRVVRTGSSACSAKPENSVTYLAGNRALRNRALLWASLNWLLDAASLWSFLAALGHIGDPVELFAAYGIANVLGPYR